MRFLILNIFSVWHQHECTGIKSLNPQFRIRICDLNHSFPHRFQIRNLNHLMKPSNLKNRSWIFFLHPHTFWFLTKKASAFFNFVFFQNTKLYRSNPELQHSLFHFCSLKIMIFMNSFSQIGFKFVIWMETFAIAFGGLYQGATNIHPKLEETFRVQLTRVEIRARLMAG